MKFLITSPKPAPPPPREFSVEITEGQAEGLIAELGTLQLHSFPHGCLYELYYGLRTLLVKGRL